MATKKNLILASLASSVLATRSADIAPSHDSFESSGRWRSAPGRAGGQARPGATKLRGTEGVPETQTARPPIALSLPHPQGVIQRAEQVLFVSLFGGLAVMATSFALQLLG